MPPPPLPARPQNKFPGINPLPTITQSSKAPGYKILPGQNRMHAFRLSNEILNHDERTFFFLFLSFFFFCLTVHKTKKKMLRTTEFIYSFFFFALMVMIDGKKMTDGRTDGRTDRKLKRGNVECVRVCGACRVWYCIVFPGSTVRMGRWNGVE